MTINSEVRTAGPFEGNDVATSFPFEFKVFADSEVLVVRELDGVELVLDLGTDYTVALNADQDSAPGGSVDLPVPLPVGYTLSMTSALKPLQPVDLTNQGGFYPRVISASLDRLTILVQQLSERLSRTLVAPISDGGAGFGDLPGVSARKGSVLAFDEVTGAPRVGPSIGAVGTVVANTGSINTVAGNTAAINAVAGNTAAINAVAGNTAAINAVAGNTAAINAVANSIADVNTVAGNVTDVTNFADVYYGPSATDPSTRRDGSPLQEGDLYFNTAEDVMRVYDGTQWGAVASGGIGLTTYSGDVRYTQRSNNLSDVTNVATARINLGLGTAATANLTTSSVDGTVGRVLKVGDGGWMSRGEIRQTPYGYPSSITDVTNQTKVIRSEVIDNGVFSYSSGIHFTAGDTWGRLRVRFNSPEAWIQGGVAGTGGIGWTSRLVLTDNLLQTAGSSTVFPMSQAAVTKVIIGVGQTWQDVTASRGPNTVYTNTTGKPIQLYITGDLNDATIYIGNVPISSKDYGGGSFICLIVPNGVTYSLSSTGTVDRKWMELR